MPLRKWTKVLQRRPWRVSPLTILVLVSLLWVAFPSCRVNGTRIGGDVVVQDPPQNKAESAGGVWKFPFALICKVKKPCKQGTCKLKPVTVNKWGYTCECLNGWEGRLCDKSIDDCKHGPCGSFGKCTDLHNSYKCECDENHSGKHCDISSDPCKFEKPCHNGGRCTSPGVGLYRCDCANTGWTGRDCDENIDHCEIVPNACENGGRCIDGIKHKEYACDCEGTGCTGPACDECEAEVYMYATYVGLPLSLGIIVVLFCMRPNRKYGAQIRSRSRRHSKEEGMLEGRDRYDSTSSTSTTSTMGSMYSDASSASGYSSASSGVSSVSGYSSATSGASEMSGYSGYSSAPSAKSGCSAPSGASGYSQASSLRSYPKSSAGFSARSESNRGPKSKWWSRK